MNVPSLAYLLVILCMSCNALSQCDRDKQQQAITALDMQVKFRFDKNHIPYFIEGNIASRVSGDPVDDTLTALRAIAPVYCAFAADDFTLTGNMSKPDDLGQTSVEVHQTYRGLEVFGPSLRVHLTHDSVDNISGQFRPAIKLSTDPAISSQEAERIALHDVASYGGIDYSVKGVRGPLVYVYENDNVCLAYAVRVGYVIDSKERYVGGPHLDDVFVNAVTGTVAGSYPLLRWDP